MGKTNWRTHAYQLRLAAGTGVLFLAAGVLSGMVARQASGLAALWPGDAVVLGILIARGRRDGDVLAIAAGGFLASLVLHGLRGDPALLSFLFAFANMSEPLIALAILRRFGRVGEMFEHVNNVLGLIVGCAVAALVSATIGSLALLLVRGMPVAVTWRGWYLAALLGQLVLTPLIVLSARLTDRRQVRSIAARTAAEVIAVLGLVAAVTGFVFLWSEMPLLFMVGPVVLFATFRLRAFGAVGAVAIVAAVSAVATGQGHGPIATAFHGPGEQVLLLQLFLACCCLTALPVSAILAERDGQAEEARRLADRFKRVVENIDEVIFRIDPAGKWAYLNPAWETLSGAPISRSLGRSWNEWIDQADAAELAPAVARVLAGDSKPIRRSVRFVTAAGPRWTELFVQSLRDGDGEIVGATGTLRDIDDRKRLEEHVMSAKRRAEQRAREATLLASTDELTGIANRRAFMRQLDREIAGAAEFGWPLAVAMFDVDHFKSVNDCHGHAVGDRVLQAIAARASAAVRGGDLVGRLGGEEFGILMPGATAEDAAAVAERLRGAMEGPHPDDLSLPAVTVSIGIAARESQREAGQLLGSADAALYAAKGAGRNRVRIAA